MAEEQIRVLIDSSTKRRFQIKCLERGIKMSTLLREFIEGWLKDETTSVAKEQSAQEISNFFQALEEGKQPTNADIVKMARLLQIKTDSLIAICDCFEENVRNDRQ
jgi:hypothetical protein